MNVAYNADCMEIMRQYPAAAELRPTIPGWILWVAR